MRRFATILSVAALLASLSAPAAAAHHREAVAPSERAQSKAESRQARQAANAKNQDEARARQEATAAKADQQAARKAETALRNEEKAVRKQEQTVRSDEKAARTEQARSHADAAAARSEGAVARHEAAAADAEKPRRQHDHQASEERHPDAPGTKGADATVPAAAVTPAPPVETVIGYDRADGHHVSSYQRTKADGTTADNLDHATSKHDK